MPVHGLPVSQHCQPSAESLLSAREAYGSLKRSNTTASLFLNALATEVQNGMACAASGMGFWQVACAEEQPADEPVYAPSVQCRSRMATRPLALSRFTNALTAFW